MLNTLFLQKNPEEAPRIQAQRSRHRLLEQSAEVLIAGLPGVNVIEPEVMKPIVL